MSPEEVVAFWFADGPANFREVWFRASPDFDAACARFAAALREALWRAGLLGRGGARRVGW